METWAAFLKYHKDSDEYNKASMEVVELCDLNKDKSQVFTKMTEAQPLVVVLKSAVDSTVQYLFNIFKLGNLILKQGMKYPAIKGHSLF